LRPLRGGGQKIITAVRAPEFLYEKREFYFIEMNTRVEAYRDRVDHRRGHCAHQIMVAAGERLPFVQRDINWAGHSIECRIAEGPA
jgi:acetyl-CoA carboxylase biotin carboxylase subunit